MNRAPADSSSQRVLFIKNLNYGIEGSDLYDLFGRYGAIRQIRLGTDAGAKTKGTAYVVFENGDDAREAMTHLNGFHLMERYIVVLYYHQPKNTKADIAAREEKVALEKAALGILE